MPALEDLLTALEEDQQFLSCVTRWEKSPERSGNFKELPEDLHPTLREVLNKHGVNHLYSHQAQSYEEVRAGRDVVVVTPTASGKTLCYNLPVLQDLLQDSEARALYLFPTKALSQDQQSALNEVILGGEIPVKVSTYDGDTPTSVRLSLRESGRVVITNPDMLHAGILPNHPKWIKFLSSLKYLVIDEVHIYRGVFGSHMTNLLRRLRRILRFYGSDPQVICCSATIGNPKELAERIIEREPVLIDRNGAPTGERHLILYNPPLVDRVQGIRRGVVLESEKLALKFLKAGVKTIVFARSRVRTELIATYINQALANVFTENGRIRVESYRGGYLPNERRAIEQGLRDGSVQGVVSTNALELGIDVGGLDVSILAGLPGSVASAWQQAGRSGRSTDLSVAIMLASASPVDQYMVKHPEYFLGASPESGWVDPDNPYILLDHLKCAAFELPFKEGDAFGGEIEELLADLEEHGVLRHTSGSWYWADRGYPAEEVSLRSTTAENIVIIDTSRGRYDVIGEMDRVSAMELLFEGAVYIHRGNQYIVTELDLENRKCYVEETDLNYYTDSIVKSDIKLLHKDEERPEAGGKTLIGDILVRRDIAKYKKIRYHSHENVGYGEISLPQEEMHTRGVLITFPENSESRRAFESIPRHLRDMVLIKVSALIRNVAPLFLLCQRRDIGVSERLRDSYTGDPTLYIYDMYPGGTGLAEGFLAQVRPILSACLDLLASCPCTRGCPSCMGPGQDSRGKGGPDKNGEENPGSTDNSNPKPLVAQFLRFIEGHAAVGGSIPNREG